VCWLLERLVVASILTCRSSLDIYHFWIETRLIKVKKIHVDLWVGVEIASFVASRSLVPDCCIRQAWIMVCVQIVEIVEISSKLNLGAFIVVLLAQFHCFFASQGNTCSSSRSPIIVALVRLPLLCPIAFLEFTVLCKIVSFRACVKE